MHRRRRRGPISVAIPPGSAPTSRRPPAGPRPRLPGSRQPHHRRRHQPQSPLRPAPQPPGPWPPRWRTSRQPSRSGRRRWGSPDRPCGPRWAALPRLAGDGAKGWQPLWDGTPSLRAKHRTPVRPLTGALGHSSTTGPSADAGWLHSQDSERKPSTFLDFLDFSISHVDAFFCLFVCALPSK